VQPGDEHEQVGKAEDRVAPGQSSGAYSPRRTDRSAWTPR
jgi:hypothetical protein